MMRQGLKFHFNVPIDDVVLDEKMTERWRYELKVHLIWK
jgi:hypothetical protein